MNTLEQLKKYTKIVADTGDFEAIEAFSPLDATTNPSLILKSAKTGKYDYLLEKALDLAANESTVSKPDIDQTIDYISVLFGLEILKKVPGRVSTEVNADLSFDKVKTIEKARKLISIYEKFGVDKGRILIKIASTWEGIRAAEVLEQEGTHTNLTLLFSKIQAVACAEAGVTLISPFVGRIYDWYKTNKPEDEFTSDNDPGVVSVREIFNYFKKFDYKTEIMGASFRNTSQIKELAGCDLLTISPDLLNDLSKSNDQIEPKLTVNEARKLLTEKINVTEELFRWEMNEDEMATEKLAQGIRVFNSDLLKLKTLVNEMILQKYGAAV
jgi:transaldolase